MEEEEEGAAIALEDLRIQAIRPLLPAACLIEELHGDASLSHSVTSSRAALARALHGADDRLIAIVGPADVHDPKAALEYAARLRTLAEKVEHEIIIVMRVFLDKPSAHAWTGMINDPDLDGSNAINKGLRRARNLLIEINRMGVPAATEYLDTISPQFVADLVSWASVGPRAANSQLLRELASGLSTPVGFHNGGGAWEDAVNAVRAGAAPHAFLSVSKQGIAGIVETTGNCDCHVVLRAETRSSSSVSNISSEPHAPTEALHLASAELKRQGLPARVLIDCAPPARRGARDATAHAQLTRAAVETVAAAVANGDESVLGVEMRSFLLAGRQDLTPGMHAVYGLSVTDACIDWSDTVSALETLANAVKQKRAKSAGAARRASEAPHGKSAKAFSELGEIRELDNLRIRTIRPLVSPACLMEELPSVSSIDQLVLTTRYEISSILHGVHDLERDRLLVVVGPSAIHCADAAMEFAARLRSVAKALEQACAGPHCMHTLRA